MPWCFLDNSAIISVFINPVAISMHIFWTKVLHLTCLILLLSSLLALVVKNPPANARDAGDVGSIPGSGRSPGVGNGSPLQYSSLQNLTDRGAWRLQSTGWPSVRHG